MVGVVEGGVAGTVPDGVHACLFDARAILGVSGVVWERYGPRCLALAVDPGMYARVESTYCGLGLSERPPAHGSSMDGLWGASLST